MRRIVEALAAVALLVTLAGCPASRASTARPCVAGRTVVMGSTVIDVGHEGHVHPGEDLLVRDRSQRIVAGCQVLPDGSVRCVDARRQPLASCSESVESRR